MATEQNIRRQLHNKTCMFTVVFACSWEKNKILLVTCDRGMYVCCHWYLHALEKKTNKLPLVTCDRGIEELDEKTGDKNNELECIHT